MGERTAYTPGTFSWADLSTSDQEGAKRFYAGLFGWEAEDMPAGPGATYTMMRTREHSVAAIAPQPEQQAKAGVPPMWQSYVTVADADESARRAGELGAHVHAPPFDVLEAGRMAVIQDPQGAFFMLWQPNRMIGAGLVNGPGLLSWNELATTDPEAASSFYGELLGWRTEPLSDSAMPYWTITCADGHTNGGMRRPQPGEPPNWGVYFGHDDVTAGLERVLALGGSKVAGPMPIGPGRIVVVSDPQGAMFSLYEGDFDE